MEGRSRQRPSYSGDGAHMGPFLSRDNEAPWKTSLVQAGVGGDENGDECRPGPSCRAGPALGQGSARVSGCRLPAMRVNLWMFQQPPPHLLALSVGTQSWPGR